MGRKARQAARKTAAAVRAAVNITPVSPDQVRSVAPSLVSALRRLVSFYVDVLKDLALVFVVAHVSDYILINRFDTVGGINLDYLK